MFGKEYRAICFPDFQCRDEQGAFTRIGSVQLIDDPQDAMNTHTCRRGHASEQAISRKEYPVLMALCCDEAETVIGRQTAMLTFQREDIAHMLWRQIIGFHASTIEDCPFLWREIEQFKLPDRQWHNKPIGKVAQHMQQSALAKVDQARRIIDDNIGH